MLDKAKLSQTPSAIWKQGRDRRRPAIGHQDQRVRERAAANRLRQSLHLARRKAGIAIADVAYDGRVLDGLIRLGLLAEDDADNQQAINKAIGLYLADQFFADGLKTFLTR